MRLLACLLIFALLSSGYCAAAHAFGNLPAEESAAAMADMPDCHGMRADPSSTNNTDQHPAKSNNMNCKACCATLVGFPVLLAHSDIVGESLKFVRYNRADHSDVRFPIFHPPKSSL